MKSRLNRMAGAALCSQLSEGNAMRRMKASGYEAIYPCDLFSIFDPSGMSPFGAELIIDAGDFAVRHRPLAEVKRLKAAISSAGLAAVSAHFMETLPPPGKSPNWIFPVHERFLETAQAAGLSFITTHIGAMFAMPKTGGKANFPERCRLARNFYGEALMIKDSLAIYRNLCFEAAKRGISVSIEIGCLELPSLSCDIDRLLEFIRDVDARNLGICVDAGHCHLRRLDLAQTVSRCGSLLFETHVHDNAGDTDSHSPLGSGTVPWRHFAGALLACGYSGLITFEQCDYEANATVWHELLKEAAQRNKAKIDR